MTLGLGVLASLSLLSDTAAGNPNLGPHTHVADSPVTWFLLIILNILMSMFAIMLSHE